MRLDLHKYLNIGYGNNRSSLNACDCGGFVTMALQDLGVDIEVDRSEPLTNKVKHTQMINSIKRLADEGVFKQTTTPYNAVFFTKVNDIYVHCGLVYKGKVLHVEQNNGVVYKDLSTIKANDNEYYEIIKV